MSETAAGGLRELKKRRLNTHIRECALELFVANGYRNTSMEQIAAAAEVAPRTVYRYFPTKDSLVVGDEEDAIALEQFREALSHSAPLEALQQVYANLLVDESPLAQQQRELVAAEPELQAATLSFALQLARQHAQEIVRHRGRPEELDAALSLTGAVAGIALMHLQRDDLSAAERLRSMRAGLAELANGWPSMSRTTP